MRLPIASIFKPPRRKPRPVVFRQWETAERVQRRVDELREKGFPRDVAIEQATEEEGL